MISSSQLNNLHASVEEYFVVVAQILGCNVAIHLKAGWFVSMLKMSPRYKGKAAVKLQSCGTARFRRLTNLTHIIQVMKHK